MGFLDYEHTKISSIAAWKFEEEGNFLGKTVFIQHLNSALSMESEEFLMESVFSKCNNPLYHRLQSNELVVQNVIDPLFQNANVDLSETLLSLESVLRTSEEAISVKSGYLFLLKMEKVNLEEEETEALAFFYCDSQDLVFAIEENTPSHLNSFEGINLKKLPLVMLIFNQEAEAGYKVLMHDSTGKQGLGYSLKNFIFSLEPIESDYTQTQSFAKLCRDFSKEVFMRNEETAAPVERVKFLEKSVQYLDENPAIDIQKFKQETLEEPKLIDAFETYQKKYQEKNNVQFEEPFDVNQQAMKSAQKYLRSIIKLDKNFHIYVHSKPELIQRGFDENRQMNYYTLYFNEER